MDELFLAIVGCDAREMELHCAVALGSDYRRSQIPMPLADCLEAWPVRNVFSVCTIAILLGETGLGKVSVPLLSLGKRRDTTLDEWYPVEPENGLGSLGRLRLLSHLRREGGAAPDSFQHRCAELLAPPNKRLTALGSDLRELHRLCQSSMPFSKRPETPQPPRGAADSPKEDAQSVYEEALAQLLSQKEALERESAELSTHWDALQADHKMKREVLSEMRAERNSIFANVEELQAEVLDVTAELKEAQAVSGSLLATRRRLQAELTACASEFNSEASAHRAVSEALRAQRARLRGEAVELGRTLQACVSRGDELVSENLQLRTESAELEDAEERSSSELRSFEQSQLAKHCRQLWQKLNSQPQEQAAQNGSAAQAKKGKKEDDLPYSSRVQALKEGADRLSRPNGCS